jgi:hypothetical protein
MTTATRSLWPEDLKTEDFRTPTEILSEQAQLLERQTNGVLAGELVEHIVQDRRVIGFHVNAPRIPTTVRLFEVQQSVDLDYPVAIFPPDIKIPEFLQSEPHVPTAMELTGAAQRLSETLKSLGVRTKNEWVASSAAEFTDKLALLLASNGVKAILLSLLARSSRKNGEAEAPGSAEK